MKLTIPALFLTIAVGMTAAGSPFQTPNADIVTLRIDSPMQPPRWAELERKLLDDNLVACREFYNKYIDDRGYLRCVVRWGANDGPDDAPENFNRWPELHALGAEDEILRMYLKGWEGHLKQYTEAKTTDGPIARQGMYFKEFISQFDWMHNGEGLQLFNRMGLSVPLDKQYRERARRFAGFYMDQDPEALNYDPKHKIIKSMMNGSRGPMLRKATALDWAGDPFDATGFTLVHREKNYKEFLAHYEEYTDVVGDHFLNLVATTQPLNAYMATGEEKYRKWILEYMDAWLQRMKDNKGVIPSKIGLDGKIGGEDGKWWGNVYGWGFSPVNPTNGRRENRNRIPRALVGFNNALWVSGDQKYVDAWRNMMNAINANGRMIKGKMQYPTMHGDQGWYGWADKPWNVGALETWYWSMKAEDLKRVPQQGWVGYLQGKNPGYPETALKRDLQSIQTKVNAFRKDKSTPDTRLSDNMLDWNPAAAAALIQLMLGGLPPSVDGGLLNARLRYFDLDRRRAGVPRDVAALVSEITGTRTVVTLVNLSKTQTRTLILQGGAYGEHQLESVTVGDNTTKVQAPYVTVRLDPGCGQKLVLEMKRYANRPTTLHPWHREEWTGEKATSEWVHPGQGGKLVYKKTAAGDRIMDFSHAGYMGGGVALPTLPVKRTVEPTDGDDTATIQAAIDAVAAMPLKDGFRGAVLLAPGTFKCSGTIKISASGVVVRGSGSGAEKANKTTIKLTGKPHNGITVGGKDAATAKQPFKEATTTITDKYVPSGATFFFVADPKGFAVGDLIAIRKPVTEAWVKFMQMHDLVRDGKPQTWLPVGRMLTTERQITEVFRNVITLDVPLSDSIDSKFLDPPGAAVVKIKPPPRPMQVGVEYLNIESPPQAIKHTDPHFTALRINGQDCWVRDVVIDETMNSVAVGGRRITLERVAVNRKALHVGSSRPAEFAPNGGQVLLDRCTVNADNVWYSATGSAQAGPIVLLNCTFLGDGRVESHQRWSTGVLYDNCQVPQGGIEFRNRGAMGSGHGWSMGWGVAWNCMAKDFLIQNPPGSANWMIGCIGLSKQSPRPFDKGPPNLPEGIMDSHGKAVGPRSLYLAQLAERLGAQAVRKIGY